MYSAQLLAALGFLITVGALTFDNQNETFAPNRLSSRSLSGFQFRIAPLGASIVNGYASTDKNGFRYGLRNQLIADGAKVNMVGSVQTGNMLDNDNEGWPGYVIDQTYDTANGCIPSQPNVVLLHVGSNDMSQDIDIGNAHNRLGRVIDKLFDSIPGVTVIASTVLPRFPDLYQQRTNIYNANIPGMIQARQKAGRKLLLADFSSSWWSNSDLHDDGTHPTDAGYQKMAAVWYQGILKAAELDWLTPPKAVAGLSDEPTAVASSTTCDKVMGNAQGPFVTQKGSGRDDGPYVHSASSVGGFSGFNNPSGVTFNNPLPEGVYWADINGDGIDDYVYVASNANQGLGVALSKGDGTFGAYLYFPFSIYCLRRGVRFADMTGDGRDDFCCLGPDGGLQCFENRKGSDERVPNFVDMGIIMAPKAGYLQAQVRLADIDGDGRADYVCFDTAGTRVYGWRNGANQNGPPAYWTPMNGVANGLPALAMSGWKFADLNGDHRDDLVWVDANTGAVRTWINQRGYSLAYTPVWQEMGVTHTGFGAPTNVTFGRFMGSSRSDYSRISIGSNGNVYVDRYQNNGKGGAMVKGDGSRYCDMTGTGSDDYIWISSVGEMTGYGNDHKLQGTWIQWGVIYTVNRARREIHLADFDGDGKCDILLVDKASGATTMLRNDYGGGKFTFTNIGVVTGGATCTEGYGYDLHDNGVRWSDIDGDGRADLLCVQQNGLTTAYLNKGIGNMVYKSQVKSAEGKERRNLRFADIDGDGRDDMLYLDPVQGAMVAWKNMGAIPAPQSLSSFTWYAKGTVAGGDSCRGSAIELVNYNGLGRADYYMIDPQANTATVYLNVCPGGGNGPVTPNLPTGAPPIPDITKTTGGYWYGGTGQTYLGGAFFEHSAGYVPGSNGASDTLTRDWCENVQNVDTFPSLGFGQMANDMHWMSVHCDMKEIENTGFDYTPAQRWAAAEASNALFQAWLCWINPTAAQAHPNLHSHTWSEHIFNYFHGGDVNICELRDSGCQDTQTCTEAGHPAGFMIMNSFVTLHRVSTLLHQQIQDAWTEGVVSQLDAALSLFSPSVKKDNLQWLKILLDVVGLGFAVAAAPVWNVALKSSARWAGTANQNNLGWIKDTTNSAVSGGITIIKDALPSPSAESASKQLHYMAGQLLTQWQEATTASLVKLFSPESKDFGVFLDLVDEGAVLERFADNNNTAKASITKALWATLIPWAWSLSNENHHPFIMIPNNIDDYYGCKKPSDLDSFIDTKNQAATMVCIGNFPYYIVSAKDGCSGCASVCEPPNRDGQICNRQRFRTLPGMEELTPDDNNIWGGVTKQEMAEGSLTTSRQYGNGWKPDLNDPNTFGEFGADGALSQPGIFFRFPACTADEAWANLNRGGTTDKEKYPNYPCNT